MADFLPTEQDEQQQAEQQQQQQVQQVHAFLDSLHQFAATARFDDYFHLFHREGQFLGTDASENWTKQEFQDWSRPFFTDVECAWEYLPVPGKRSVVVQQQQQSNGTDSPPTYALFDEVLYCCDLKCHTRGSGTLVYEDGRWQLMLYHITFPIEDEKKQPIMNRLMQGRQLKFEKALLKSKENEAEAAAQQLLAELGMDDTEASKIKSTKSKKSKKKK